MRSLWVVALLGLVACKSELATPLPQHPPESVSLGCDDYQSIETEVGVLYNNVWNKQADDTGNATQCLTSRTVEGTLQYGWSWSWPKGKRVIYAYPQIKRGPSPWAPRPRGDNRLPARIAAIQTLELEFDTETASSGIYNLAASMWITTEPVTGDNPRPSAIAAEMMIWTYASKGHFNPAGKKVTEVQLDGTLWEVWVDRSWGDASGVNDNQWTYITYRSTTNSQSANLDLTKMLDYAVQQQWISAEQYISNVELGNEIMSGSGVTWVKSFNLTIQFMQ